MRERLIRRFNSLAKRSADPRVFVPRPWQDTKNVEPLSSISEVTLPMRADKVTDGGIAEKVLANAPGGAVYIDPTDKSAGGFFTVPKVVE